MQLPSSNLWDVMQHFMTWQFVHAWDFLWEIANSVERVAILGAGRDVPVTDAIAENTIPKLSYCRQQFAVVGLSNAIERIDRKLLARLRPGHRLTFDELHTQLGELRDDVHRELWQRRFAYLSSEKIEINDVYARAWEELGKSFPKADEAKDARDCYALDMNTASVFHSMRVVEHGLRALAKKVRVTLTHKGKVQPIEYADWEKVITAIKSMIGAARLKPHGKKREDTLNFYSDAADHCLYLRDIWRNEVSHTRRRYNDAEALAALNRMQEFMELLAKSL